MTSIPTIAAEKESLETHVDLCAERYKELDFRLGSVETKLDKLTVRVDNIGAEFKKSLLNAVATIIVGLVGSAGTIVAVIITHAK